MEIKNRYTGEVIAIDDTAKEAAQRNTGDLREANLYGANLYGADLRGANLYEEIARYRGAVSEARKAYSQLER